VTVDADVVVVGSGLNGGWAAKTLAERGLSVIVLEAGPRYSLGAEVTEAAWAVAHDPADDETRRRRPVMSQQMYFHGGNAHLFADEVDHPLTHPDDASFVWIRSRQVGGRGVLWARVALRMSDHEFFAARRDGIGPAWPFGHAELDEHYAAVERRHGVAGANGGGPTLPDGIFLPPLELSPAERELVRRVPEVWPTRKVIAKRVILPARPGTGEWPSFTPQGSCLGDAEQTGRVEIRSDAVAFHIDSEGPGPEATAIRYLDRRAGAERIVRARAFVLAASTIETVRLLLASRSRRHPGGLGGSGGWLGRGIMDHVGLQLIGQIPDAAPMDLDGARMCGAYMPRFSNVPGGEDADFARGYGVILTLQPALKPDLAILATCGEMLPYRENTVSLDDTVVDADGLPAPRVECRLGDNERRMLLHQEKTLRELAALAKLRVLHVTPPLVPGQFIHECGGARMGTERESSVTDGFGRVWDSPNVVVVDGSCWPTGGYQNPTLTMMAIARRSSLALANQLERSTSAEGTK
jgi:choline dehydrogenase-like flavoprotein